MMKQWNSLWKLSTILMLAAVVLLSVSLVQAAPVASVTHVSGPLLVRKADGSSKVLAIGSKVDTGDTVVTQKRTYARLKFTDGAEVVLKPNTQFKVEQYSYDQAKPKDDAGSFNLIKGGLRAVTGQIGKRGNQDAYRMKTPTATIGIRGTIFTAIYVEPGEQAAEGLPEPVLLAFAEQAPVMSDAQPFLVADAGGPPVSPGLFVYTWQGSVMVTNSAGSFPVPQNTGFQFTGPSTPPVPIPPSGMPTFTPPAYFPPPGTGTPPPGSGTGVPNVSLPGPSGNPPSGSGSGGGGGACQVPGSM